MNIALKIIGVIFVSLIFAVVFKAKRSEYALILSVAAVVGIAVYLLSSVVPVVKKLCEKFTESGGDEYYIKTAVKALMIAFLTGVTAETCRDHNQNSLALAAEVTGKCLIFILCVPILESVLEISLGFLNL